MDYRKNIGANIRNERRKRDLTIEELAYMLNLNPGFLGLIERGERGTAIDNLCRISELFCMTLDNLIKSNPNEQAGDLLSEPSQNEKKSRKYSIATNLLKSLSEDELDFAIVVLKGMSKLSSLTKSQNNNDSGSDDDQRTPASY